MTGEFESDVKVWRVLDASTNRAGEGLRTIEEYARFCLDDGFLTSRLKGLRHQIADVCRGLSRTSRMRSRDTLGDIGTQISTGSEMSRPQLDDVLVAAIQRVQESLRCLEEYSKLIDPKTAQRFEQCRYQSYTLFAAVEQCRARCNRFDGKRIYALIDAGCSIDAMVSQILELADAGIDVIQLREKNMEDRELFLRARQAATVLRPYDCLFIVNDRADIAAASGADGVHVGQEELPVAEARRIVGTSRLVGVSTHSIDQARTAVLEGADYIGCGPTFPSGTKTFETFPGLAFLSQVAGEITLPHFAIGGITAHNVEQVASSGVGRIAVCGALREVENLKNLIDQMKRSLSASREIKSVI